MFLTKLRDQNDKALQTFFRGRDRKELEGLRNALEATRSAQDAAVNPPTGQRLAPYLVGGGAIADLGLTIAGTLGSAIGYTRLTSLSQYVMHYLNWQTHLKVLASFEKALSELELCPLALRSIIHFDRIKKTIPIPKSNGVINIPTP